MPKFNLDSVGARSWRSTVVEEKVIPMAGRVYNEAFRKRVITPIHPDSFDVFHGRNITTITVMHIAYRGAYSNPRRRRTVFTFETLYQARAFFKWAWSRDLTGFTVDCYDALEKKRLVARQRRQRAQARAARAARKKR